jgi:hypothetical protein
MIKLDILAGSAIDLTLEDLWGRTDIDVWEEFVMSLPDVIDATFVNQITTVTFESEEHKNWFLLTYS